MAISPILWTYFIGTVAGVEFWAPAYSHSRSSATSVFEAGGSGSTELGSSVTNTTCSSGHRPVLWDLDTSDFLLPRHPSPAPNLFPFSSFLSGSAHLLPSLPLFIFSLFLSSFPLGFPYFTPPRVPAPRIRIGDAMPAGLAQRAKPRKHGARAKAGVHSGPPRGRAARSRAARAPRELLARPRRPGPQRARPRRQLASLMGRKPCVGEIVPRWRRVAAGWRSRNCPVRPPLARVAVVAPPPPPTAAERASVELENWD